MNTDHTAQGSTDTLSGFCQFSHLFGPVTRYNQPNGIGDKPFADCLGIERQHVRSTRAYMSKEECKALIHEFFHAISGKPKPSEVVNRYIAESDEALRRHILQYEVAFPRFELTVEDMIGMGACVIVCLILRGTHMGDFWSLPPTGMEIAPPLRPTHTGEFMGVSPTGRQIVFPMLVLYRITAGKIVEHRIHYSAADLLNQLEFSPQESNHGAGLCEAHGRQISLWQEIPPSMICSLCLVGYQDKAH